MKVNDLRELYLAFFEEKNHLRQPSASLIPHNDNSLLIINSGMAPLKPYFVGLETPPSQRVTTCQKCIRTGDIENVGKTARHGTFFEMLGNFSFNDYFKIEAIQYAWEFCTQRLKLPAEKIHITVYEEDDEAYDMWTQQIGIPHARMVRLGKDDNFWEVGVGPCGPCSELYFDRGIQYGCGSDDCQPGCDCDRFMEFWNLVFTQFNREEDGTYSKLDRVNIDTGMGLERMAVIMQAVDSLFDVDTVATVRDTICQLAGVGYKQNPTADISIRKVTDHVRSITFMLSDGIQPSNEGRGYVLRRLLRVAVRHGRKLGIQGHFLEKVAKVAIAQSQDAYPELAHKRDFILTTLNTEETNFHKTLDTGNERIEKLIAQAKASGNLTISGADSFKMYDTYGFPLELMQEIVEEQGLSVDVAGYQVAMNAQKDRARNARGESDFLGTEGGAFANLGAIDTRFLGYTQIETTATIQALIQANTKVEQVTAGTQVGIITDATTLYPQSGGQDGDQGLIVTDTAEVRITDTKKIAGKTVHLGEVVTGTLQTGETVRTISDLTARLTVSRNHTATHLLHATLREVLGPHVTQSGAEKSQDKLRFDFSHTGAVTKAELERIEDRVNASILQAMPVTITEMPLADAKAAGAMALFGEKYGETVRVVRIGFDDAFSIELCGGTHVPSTSNIGLFKITSEGGIAQGVRRIEAITGANALAYMKQKEQTLTQVAETLKATGDIVAKAEQVMADNKGLRKTLETLHTQAQAAAIDGMLDQVTDIQGKQTFIARFDNTDQNAMKTMADKVKDKLGSCVVVLIGENQGTVPITVVVSDDYVKTGLKAGDMAKQLAQLTGGNGGGRPNMATAQGKDPSQIDAAIALAKTLI